LFSDPKFMMDASVVFAAFATSIISGAIGMMGGILLLSVMTLVFPPALLIPIHGVTQFASNGSRTLMNLKEVRLPIVLPFLFGAVLGAALGSQVVVSLSQSTFSLLIGSFIL